MISINLLQVFTLHFNGFTFDSEQMISLPNLFQKDTGGDKEIEFVILYVDSFYISFRDASIDKQVL